MEIKEICRKEFDALIASGGGTEATFVDDGYRPLGSFLMVDGEKIVGIDNTTGNAWTEEFDDRYSCERWLSREESEESEESEDIMKNSEMTVSVKVTLTSQDIDDIMCAALEGGIAYWCDQAEVVGEYLGEYGHEQISRGGKLILHDAESDDKWELDLEKLLKGIQMYLEKEGADIIENGHIDTCIVDGNCADCMVQYAIFGELTFG